jgi:hypothetical protein
MKRIGKPEQVTPPIAEQELDDAIDRAVREITNVEPKPGLDRRVRARLEQPGGTRVVWWPRLAAAGLTAAALLAFAMMNWRTPDSPPPAVVIATPRPVPALRIEGPVAAARPAPETAPRHRRPPGVAPLPMNLVRAASVTETETAVAVVPLEAIAPIQMAPVEPESMHVSQITIDPIQVRPLRLEPLPSTPH